MKIGIFGACREGVDALRVIRGSRFLNDDTFAFIDNDKRVIGRSLENVKIYHPDDLLKLSLDLIFVAVIDVHKIEGQIRSLGYSGEIKFFYGDQYYSTEERYIGMAKIGRYSYCKPSTFLYNVEIGNFCHIGADCRLGLIGHDPKSITTYPLRLKSLKHEFEIEGASEKRLDPLIIEDDVYIGEGVSVLAGITIGRGAIIGSRSLVTSSVDPYTVVGGIPAKRIADRLNPELQALLEGSRWVGLDIDAAIETIGSLTKKHVR